jgi:hypothetical protein
MAGCWWAWFPFRVLKSWFARIVAVFVRSANSPSCCSFIRRDTSAVESAKHLAPTQGVKFKLLGITLYRHRPLSPVAGKCLVALNFMQQTKAYFYLIGD